jgi:ATP phosphoribosyltransferase
LTYRISRGGHFTRKSEGRTYRRLRDPEIVADVQRGAGDVGFLGSDKVAEWNPDSLAVDWVGDVEGCDFVLAALRGRVPEVKGRLEGGGKVYAVTSNVNWLAKFAVANGWTVDIRRVSGSAEAYGEEADMVADLRVSGDTLSGNGLEEFKILDSVKLGMIYRGVPSVQLLNRPA